MTNCVSCGMRFRCQRPAHVTMCRSCQLATQRENERCIAVLKALAQGESLKGCKLLEEAIARIWRTSPTGKPEPKKREKQDG